MFTLQEATETVNTTLTTIAKVANQVINVTNYYKDKSLVDITRLTRVEPLTILSRDCLALDYMPDVQQSVLSIFTAYYLQAINLISAVKSVEVVRTLDRLNPNRDETGFLLSETLSTESYLSLESLKYSLLKPTSRLVLEADGGGGGGQKQKMENLSDVVNLSVGRMIKVEICYPANEKTGAPGGSVQVPINIRLMASNIPTNSICNVLAHQAEDTTLTERYHAWRSGRISMIKDLVLCQDLIDEHKRATISDDSRTLQNITQRVLNNKKFGALTQNPSLATASNIFVFTEEVSKELARKLGGRISSPTIRKKAFENTYAMLLVEIDRERQLVTFYTRNIAESSTFTIKELQAANKGKGPDVADIMKSFNMGMPASF